MVFNVPEDVKRGYLVPKTNNSCSEKKIIKFN